MGGYEGKKIKLSNNEPKSLKELNSLTQSQWKIIQSIEKSRSGMKVPNTTSLFEDDIWRGDEGALNWNTYFGEKERVLRLIVKDYIYESFRIRKTTLTSERSKLSLVSEFIRMLRDRKILIAKEGAHLQGLSLLTESDLLNAIDIVVLKTNKNLNALVYKLRNMEWLLDHCRVLSNKAPFLFTSVQMPWVKSGLPAVEWVKQRVDDLGHFLAQSLGYKALPPETYYPLIERSLFIIDELSQELIELNGINIGINESNKKTGTFRVVSKDEQDIIGERFEGVFECIDIPVKRYERKMAVSWINDVLYLARTACINIILLTTGLRNIDLRELKVGCCIPSKTEDSLYYIPARIKKTSNFVHIPVPVKTFDAVELLTELKNTTSEYLIDHGGKSVYERKCKNGRAKINCGDTINDYIRSFANHFKIPFEWEEKSGEYSTHCFRSTVAGFLSESSNMAVVMIRRLFGHTNNFMPTFYQRNNPIFYAQQKEDHLEAAKYSAEMITNAVINGKVTGPKGEDIKRGFEKFKNESQSMTDKQLRMSFTDLIQQRIINGTACGFLTPFGVICMRNPIDTSQSPCSKRAHKDVVKGIGIEVLDVLSAIDPPNCIGAGCSEAMLGPWSESIVESLIQYKKLIKHQLGDMFTEQHFIDHADDFIRTYEPLIKPVFGDSYDKE